MAKRTEKAAKFGKFGLILSLIAGAFDVLALAVILPKWNFQEMTIYLGTIRQPIVLASIAMAFVLGFIGFLLGLEAASHGEDNARPIGWIGFWVGSIGAMLAIILGLIYVGYKF